MSELKWRCRAAIGILEATRSLIEAATVEAGAKAWEGSERDARTVMTSIERIQQRLVLKYYSPSDIRNEG